MKKSCPCWLVVCWHSCLAMTSNLLYILQIIKCCSSSCRMSCYLAQVLTFFFALLEDTPAADVEDTISAAAAAATAAAVETRSCRRRIWFWGWQLTGNRCIIIIQTWKRSSSFKTVSTRRKMLSKMVSKLFPWNIKYAFMLCMYSVQV